MLQLRRRRSHQSKLSAFQSKQKDRSLKSVLIEDTEELCYMLASCTKAIIGIRVYSCLIKKYRRKNRDKNRLGISKIRQIPNLAMKQFKSSLKVISGVGSANISRSFRESTSENHETILNEVDDEIDEEEDEGYPEQFVCSICVDLLCKPCKLICGHTFCKVCLLKVAINQQANIYLAYARFVEGLFFSINWRSLRLWYPAFALSFTAFTKNGF